MTQALAVVLSIQIAFLPCGFALRVQITSNVKIRVHKDKAMERVGLLKKGSIVQIPDEYTVLKDGKPDLDLTLNNWLKTAGERRGGRTPDGAGLYRFDGERSEFFFPVRITNPASGSTINPKFQDSRKFIAIKNLLNSGNAMIVSDDAEITASDEAPPEQARLVPPLYVANDPNAEMAALSTCANGLCASPSDVSAPVRELIDQVSSGLAFAAEHAGRLHNRTATDLKLIAKTFQSSCGFSLSEFIPVVVAQAKAAAIPPEVLLSIMTQENSGRCYKTNSESDSTQSLGIFQVNSTNKNYPRCSTDQIRTLQNIHSVDGLSTGPRCVENPLVNLSEAIGLLNGKKTALARGGFNLLKLADSDVWRLTASAYNGGQRWAFEAKRDLENFNSLHGTDLNAYNWEDLRIFFMREWLNRGEKTAAFGDPNEGRSRENSVSNLAYAENIAGRPATDSSRPSLMSAWQTAILTRNDSNKSQ